MARKISRPLDFPAANKSLSGLNAANKLTFDKTHAGFPTWSPLGNQIVYEYAETTGNIWIADLK